VKSRAIEDFGALPSSRWPTRLSSRVPLNVSGGSTGAVVRLGEDVSLAHQADHQPLQINHRLSAGAGHRLYRDGIL